MADFLPLPEKEYSVIYADPPWSYQQGGKTKSSHGIAKQHYQTMTTEDICNLPVRKICGGGCLLSVGNFPKHRLNVYYRLRNIAIRDLADKEDPGKCRLSEEQEETVAVIALLHDVCKVGCYHMETKRRKNPETGRWEDYEGYTYKDPLPWATERKACT